MPSCDLGWGEVDSSGRTVRSCPWDPGCIAGGAAFGGMVAGVTDQRVAPEPAVEPAIEA